jgi:hypothetical protein
MKVIMLNNAMALPRSTGPQMSAKTPGALDSVLDAKVPVRNLPTSNAAKFGAKAQRKLKARYSKNVK